MEYASLSSAKRAGLLIKCKKHGKKGGKAQKKKRANSPKPKKNQLVNLSKGTNKANATMVWKDNDGSDEGSSSDKEIPMKPPAKKAKLSKS